MTREETEEYGAVLIDTSIFIQHSLRLETGLLGKLSQFKESPITLLLPDVIQRELLSKLDQIIRSTYSDLLRAVNKANHHLFVPTSMSIERDIEGLATNRLLKFIDETGALILQSDELVKISDLLLNYFQNLPPFAENGKKKNEFPDAIALMATEEWVRQNRTKALVISTDSDWEGFCSRSDYLDYEKDLVKALSGLNKKHAGHALTAAVESDLNNLEGGEFLASIRSFLEDKLDGITTSIEAESGFHWDLSDMHVCFRSFELVDNVFRVIDEGSDEVVLETLAEIEVEASGSFMLSVYDSIDKDYVFMDEITKVIHEKFETEILITLCGDLNASTDDLELRSVDIVRDLPSIDFGFLEPDPDTWR